MGASESVPNPDQRTLKAMEQINIGIKELGVFWRHFRKGDKDLTGTVDIDTFYGLFDEQRSIFGDGIFDINDITRTDTLDFGEYMTAVVMYCLFEPPEILRFCMFIFDRDKNGYMEKEEILLMLRILYKITPPGGFKGNIALALAKIDWHPDGKVDWKEFNEIHHDFPSLFHPAFRIQLSMINETMGQRWWDRKKRQLFDEKVRKAMIEQLSARKEHGRLVKLREKRVRKKMGVFRYFLCPGQRKMYRDLFPIDDVEADRKLNEMELAEQKKRQREIERRIRELRAKNPETHAWHEYKKRKARKDYAASKVTEAPRERRSLVDRDRKMRRRRGKVADAQAD
ncbi:hypothetical protein M885DRAFT_522568 [Pelagophyceae sp. CCMP2097]|nr:hypothetical protein M885DRAFT_522568 [Pelagophyceae sp. CCMP2097]